MLCRVQLLVGWGVADPLLFGAFTDSGEFFFRADPRAIGFFEFCCHHQPGVCVDVQALQDGVEPSVDCAAFVFSDDSAGCVNQSDVVFKRAGDAVLLSFLFVALESVEFIRYTAFSGGDDAFLDAGVVAAFGRVGHAGADGVEIAIDHGA